MDLSDEQWQKIERNNAMVNCETVNKGLVTIRFVIKNALFKLKYFKQGHHMDPM